MLWELLGEIGWTLRMCRYVCTPNLRLRNTVSIQGRRRAALHSMATEHTLGNTVEVRVQAGSTEREVGGAARADSLDLRPKHTRKTEDPNAGFY